MKLNRIHLVAALTFLASPVLALVQPMAINFQGKLVNPTTNAPATGTAQLTFKIFNAASGGTQMWTEGPDGVVVTNGVFSLTIGTNTAIPREVFLGATAYLEITVNSVNGTADGTAMTPRQPLVMSPYAFTANQLSDQNEVRLIAGPTYSTFTSAGNLTVPFGITGSTLTITDNSLTVGVSSFTVGGGSATVAYSFTAGSLSASTATLTYGLVASSASFGARGSNVFYGVTVSSGIDMNNGTLALIGSAGLDATGTGIKAATGTFTSTVTALSFTGDGSGLTAVTPDIIISSNGVGASLVANTEKIIAYSTVTFTKTTSKAFVIGNVGFSGGTSATGTGRLFVSAVGGTCSTASTLVHAARFAIAVTANGGNNFVIYGLDTHAATVGTFVYCFSIKSTGANAYLDHELVVIDASPASTTSLGL